MSKKQQALMHDEDFLQRLGEAAYGLMSKDQRERVEQAYQALEGHFGNDDFPANLVDVEKEFDSAVARALGNR